MHVMDEDVCIFVCFACVFGAPTPIPNINRSTEEIWKETALKKQQSIAKLGSRFRPFVRSHFLPSLSRRTSSSLLPSFPILCAHAQEKMDSTSTPNSRPDLISMRSLVGLKSVICIFFLYPDCCSFPPSYLFIFINSFMYHRTK